MKIEYKRNILEIDANDGEATYYMRIRTAEFYIEPEKLQLLITKMQEALDRSNSLINHKATGDE